MSPALRDELYVPLEIEGEGMDQLVLQELLAGRDVVVSGTAGGGKTMLVEQVLNVLTAAGRTYFAADLCRVVQEVDLSVDVVVVRDLTATGTDIVAQIWALSERPPLLLAGNEGMLLEATFGDGMSPVVSALRALQEGTTPSEPRHPVVIDMASIDPVKHGLPSLLASPLLYEAAVASETSLGYPPDSPRVLALDQLRTKRVAQALADHIRTVLGPGEVTYRELWNFVSDLFLGGSNDSVPPTSPWFWRAFYGDNSLSLRIGRTSRGEFLSLPSVSLALYREDIDRFGLEPEMLASWVPAGTRAVDCSGTQSQDLVRWNRLQFVALSDWAVLGSSRLFVGSRQRTSGLDIESPRGIVQLINRYFTPADSGQGSALELWVDPGVERRQQRPEGIVSLGRISLAQLEIASSSVIANSLGREVRGSRKFLRLITHRDASCSLEISGDLIHGLLNGRSLRTYDRNADEVDLSLRRFFFACASLGVLEEPDAMTVHHETDSLVTSRFTVEVGAALRIRGDAGG